MTYQVDQSGKIEQTNKDTVVALSNDHVDSILVKAKTKRQIQEVFRRHGQVRNFILFTFSALLAVLIQRNKTLGRIIIDTEYAGKEPVIKELIKEILGNKEDLPLIHFQQIGKQVAAHQIAHDTATKEIKPKKILGFTEVMKLIKMTEVGKRLKNA